MLEMSALSLRPLAAPAAGSIPGTPAAGASPYERILKRNVAKLLAELAPQVERACAELRDMGIQARLVGSYALGGMTDRSDVDFLILDRAGKAPHQVFQAIAKHVRRTCFDIVYWDELDENGRIIMEMTNP